MAVGKASILRAVNAETKKTADTGEIRESVISPMNSKEIQVKFFGDKAKQAKPGAPVRINEELPEYLL